MGYYTTGILHTDTITDDDITIDIKRKKIYINCRMSYIGFLSFLYPYWHGHPELCRIRIPVALTYLDIEVSNKWHIVNKENILLPSYIKTIYMMIF